MVILSAAVTTRGGKTLLARQYREISRIRIEGLLAAFPKLIGSDTQQHTYVETDSVRYVYQPVETLYVLLITTKNSNIVEDLETLRLLGKVLPEYSPRYGSVDEETVMEASFEIIYSFDEVVDWGGYRENVDLQQIATYTEMYSHEERLATMIKESKMQEAKEERKRREAEINKQRNDGNDRFGIIGNEIGNLMKASGMGGLASDLGFGAGGKRGGGKAYAAAGGISSDTYQEQMGLGGRVGMGDMGKGVGGSGGFGSGGFGSGGFGGGGGYAPSSSSYGREDSRPLPVSGSMAKKGMSLGKSRKQDSILAKLRAEGEVVDSTPKLRKGPQSAAAANAAQYAPPTEAVHFSAVEKLNLTVSKDGGVQNLDIKGDLMLRITDPSKGAIRVAVDVGEVPGLQMRTHPNIDKPLYASQKVLGLKDPNRPFPTGNPLGVLRWRLSSKDESMCPILINCWPSESGDESQVNIEYELAAKKQLQDVVITIPIGTGNQPTVSNCDGEFVYNSRTQNVEWRIPMIDSSNAQGSLEFSCAAMDSSNFFPVNVSFACKQTYAEIQVQKVFGATTNEPVQFTHDATLIPETFTIV